MRRLGSTCTSFSTSVVLPVPEGADTMNSSPRTAGACATRSGRGAAASLDILHLLAHAFELGFGFDDQLGDVQAIGFGANGVDLAVHLLEQKIELAPARFDRPRQRVPMLQVTAKAGDLLADVG